MNPHGSVNEVMCRLIGNKLLVETPEMHACDGMQAFIRTEQEREQKRWVWEIIRGAREADEVRVRTPEFVVLPDTERPNRDSVDVEPPVRSNLQLRSLLRAPASPWMLEKRRWDAWQRQAPLVNWLGIATDPGLRSLRDVRGRHAPMLREMLEATRARISEETGVDPDEVMAYVHYPPSVYQLHVHFAYPYAQYNHHDVYRIHSVETVLANLALDPEYYAKASLQA